MKSIKEGDRVFWASRRHGVLEVEISNRIISEYHGIKFGGQSISQMVHPDEVFETAGEAEERMRVMDFEKYFE